MAEKKNGKKPPPRRVGGERARKKINVLALIEALEQHVLGEKEMTATQVSAALALLKKTLPDLAGAPPKAGGGAGKAHEDALRDLE